MNITYYPATVGARADVPYAVRDRLRRELAARLTRKPAGRETRAQQQTRRTA